MTDYPRADRWGRPGIIPEGGTKPMWHTRVTTVAKTLDDMNGLMDWAGVMVAGGAALRPDILAQIAARWPRTEDNKAELNELAAQLKEAASASAGANLGDALHHVIARRSQGEDFRLLPTLEPDVKAFDDLLERHGIEIDREFVERTVVLPDQMVAGSFDFLARKGERFIADLKSGQNLGRGWQAIAVQLSLYSRAKTIYDWETDTHRPMPEVNQHHGLIVHLPAGSASASLYVVDLDAGWEAAEMSLWVRNQWRKRKDLARPARTN